jgi:hypothetical protein
MVEGNKSTLPAAMPAVRSSPEAGRLSARRGKKSLARIATAKKSLGTRQRAISGCAAQQLADELKEWFKDSDD